ncbi:MAG: 3D domain-containing protein [Acidobacteria bacterium]|nr:3D domain-containing protein [Acidobacteriota bacterium]
MVISGSFWRKTLVTVVAAGAFVWLFEATMLDSKYAARLATFGESSAMPAPGARLAFSATAYCKGMVTTSGVAVQTGIAAADPELLPVGSIVQIDELPPKYNGIYTVLDTGPSVQGRLVDVYMWSCYEALEFGRKPIRLTVLRLGWNPHAISPGLMERVFKRPEKPALPSRPLPQVGK